MPQLPPILMGITSLIWNIMSAQNFCGQKIFHTARFLKNMILDIRKISGNLSILHQQQLIFLKSTTNTIYTCTYTINLWSQNNFLIDVAASLCKMVDVTFEPHDLSRNCMPPTLHAWQEIGAKHWRKRLELGLLITLLEGECQVGAFHLLY